MSEKEQVLPIYTPSAVSSDELEELRLIKKKYTKLTKAVKFTAAFALAGLAITGLTHSMGSYDHHGRDVMVSPHGEHMEGARFDELAHYGHFEGHEDNHHFKDFSDDESDDDDDKRPRRPMKGKHHKGPHHPPHKGGRPPFDGKHHKGGRPPMDDEHYRGERPPFNGKHHKGGRPPFDGKHHKDEHRPEGEAKKDHSKPFPKPKKHGKEEPKHDELVAVPDYQEVKQIEEVEIGEESPVEELTEVEAPSSEAPVEEATAEESN